MTSRIAFRSVVADNGNTNANVDGSVTPVTFSYHPPANEVVRIDNVSAVFASVGNIQSLNDFVTVPGLTNGITLDVQSIGVQDLRPGVIKNNINLLQFLTSTFEEKAIGSNTIYSGTVNLKQGIILRGFFNDYYSFIINDNLTGLSLVNVILTGDRFVS